MTAAPAGAGTVPVKLTLYCIMMKLVPSPMEASVRPLSRPGIHSWGRLSVMSTEPLKVWPLSAEKKTWAELTMTLVTQGWKSTGSTTPKCQVQKTAGWPSTRALMGMNWEPSEVRKMAVMMVCAPWGFWSQMAWMLPPPLRLTPRSVKALPRGTACSPSALTATELRPASIMMRDMEAESPCRTMGGGPPVAAAMAGRAARLRMATNERIEELPVGRAATAHREHAPPDPRQPPNAPEKALYST